MATFLFDQTIFGPIKSRRLGVSLGINLLPNDRKLCTFDCVYCECGWNPKGNSEKPQLPKVEDFEKQLKAKLEKMVSEGVLPDVITFAGNGEPTIHPNFPEIVDITIELRNQFAPQARIAVLSNSTLLDKPKVVAALQKIDDPILKLDGGFEETIRAIDLPVKPFNLNKTIEQLKSFGSKVIIQTLFVKGTYNGISFNNTLDAEVDAWIGHLKQINPNKVMVYSIDRDTPAQGLIKIEKEILQKIADRLIHETGINVEVSG